MSNKKLLILGASYYQTSFILKAKSLGYTVLVCDNKAENLGHRLADQSYVVDTTDKNSVLELALSNRIDGIISPCTDVAVPTVAYVSEKMGFRGCPVESAVTVCSKILFRNFLSRHNFPHPDYVPFHKVSDYSNISLDGLWVVKPDQSSGSKGVYVVTSSDELRLRLPESCDYSLNGKAIVERYIHGIQGTCEGILCNGEVKFSTFLDKKVVAPPYTTTCGHYIPSIISDFHKSKLLTMLQDIWHKLGYTDGIFDCDFVANEDDVYILELTPRVGGNSISKLLNKSMGIDIEKYVILDGLSEFVEVPRPTEPKPMLSILIGVSHAGKFYYNSSRINELVEKGIIESIFIDVPNGYPVHPFINGRFRLGELYIHGESREELDYKLVQALNLLELRST